MLDAMCCSAFNASPRRRNSRSLPSPSRLTRRPSAVSSIVAVSDNPIAVVTAVTNSTMRVFKS